MALAHTDPDSCQTRHTLFEALGVSGIDFRCRVHPEPAGPEEPNPTHSIVLLRRGLFQLQHKGSALVADANHVLFFNRGEPYRYAHPLPGGDDCTILTVETAVARQLVARLSPRDAEHPEAPFRLGHGLASKELSALHYRLLASLRTGPEPLELEDRVAELLEETLRAAYRTHAERTEREGLSPRARGLRRERVEQAKIALQARLEAPPSLAELAAELGWSPFHLSRSFHAETGLRLRRYLTRLRAALAADRLRAGAADLTGLALDLGFSDHAHFTHAFRSEWGLPPSALRALFRDEPGR